MSLLRYLSPWNIQQQQNNHINLPKHKNKTLSLQKKPPHILMPVNYHNYYKQNRKPIIKYFRFNKVQYAKANSCSIITPKNYKQIPNIKHKVKNIRIDKDRLINLHKLYFVQDQMNIPKSKIADMLKKQYIRFKIPSC